MTIFGLEGELKIPDGYDEAAHCDNYAVKDFTTDECRQLTQLDEDGKLRTIEGTLGENKKLECAHCSESFCSLHDAAVCWNCKAAMCPGCFYSEQVVSRSRKGTESGFVPIEEPWRKKASLVGYCRACGVQCGASTLPLMDKMRQGPPTTIEPWSNAEHATGACDSAAMAVAAELDYIFDECIELITVADGQTGDKAVASFRQGMAAAQRLLVAINFLRAFRPEVVVGNIRALFYRAVYNRAGVIADGRVGGDPAPSKALCVTVMETVPAYFTRYVKPRGMWALRGATSRIDRRECAITVERMGKDDRATRAEIYSDRSQEKGKKFEKTRKLGKAALGVGAHIAKNPLEHTPLKLAKDAATGAVVVDTVLKEWVSINTQMTEISEEQGARGIRNTFIMPGEKPADMPLEAYPTVEGAAVDKAGAAQVAEEREAAYAEDFRTKQRMAARRLELAEERGLLGLSSKAKRCFEVLQEIERDVAEEFKAKPADAEVDPTPPRPDLNPEITGLLEDAPPMAIPVTHRGSMFLRAGAGVGADLLLAMDDTPGADVSVKVRKLGPTYHGQALWLGAIDSPVFKVYDARWVFPSVRRAQKFIAKHLDELLDNKTMTTITRSAAPTELKDIPGASWSMLMRGNTKIGGSGVKIKGAKRAAGTYDKWSLVARIGHVVAKVGFQCGVDAKLKPVPLPLPEVGDAFRAAVQSTVDYMVADGLDLQATADDAGDDLELEPVAPEEPKKDKAKGGKSKKRGGRGRK